MAFTHKILLHSFVIAALPLMVFGMEDKPEVLASHESLIGEENVVDAVLNMARWPKEEIEKKLSDEEFPKIQDLLLSALEKKMIDRAHELSITESQRFASFFIAYRATYMDPLLGPVRDTDLRNLKRIIVSTVGNLACNCGHDHDELADWNDARTATENAANDVMLRNAESDAWLAISYQDVHLVSSAIKDGVETINKKVLPNFPHFHEITKTSCRVVILYALAFFIRSEKLDTLFMVSFDAALNTLKRARLELSKDGVLKVIAGSTWDKKPNNKYIACCARIMKAISH